MQKILFLRKFKKVSGGHIKVFDYFMHCLHHSGLDPYLYIAPDSKSHCDELWAEVPKNKNVSEAQVELYDVIFLAGKDWELLPPTIKDQKIINLIQHVRHGDPSNVQFSYLSRAALRICVSQEVLDAIAPYTNGEAIVINNGIPLDLFSTDAQKLTHSILIWAGKNPSLGKWLYKQLKQRGIKVNLLLDILPREEFAREVGKSDIFVALPHKTEGFYLPALEAMAGRCVVICSDAVGNRSFCIHNETCLMPEFDNYESHLAMINQLLVDRELMEKIRASGFEMAQSYSLESERKQFYLFLEKFIL